MAVVVFTNMKYLAIVGFYHESPQLSLRQTVFICLALLAA
jgi:hypothetical protein